MMGAKLTEYKEVIGEQFPLILTRGMDNEDIENRCRCMS